VVFLGRKACAPAGCLASFLTVSQQVNLTLREADLWGQRVDELGLSMEASPLWALIERVHQELGHLGVEFRPRYYVSNEWGCPDGQPLVGIPFYLVDPRLHAIEEEHADDLEEDDRILMGIRHEIGHAISYAYRLYADPAWEAVFGAYDKTYDDDYNPEPFSRRCVRHLPGWYAQKHPDEDFAETFAVWLTPGSAWRERYPDGPVRQKLEYVDRVVRGLAGKAPIVDPASVIPDPYELDFTVGEFYAERAQTDAPPVHELGVALDEDLRELFTAEGVGMDAASVIWDNRKVIMRSVSGYAGSRLYVVKVLIDAVARRARELDLRAVHGREHDALIGLTALATVLVRNFLRHGHFLPDGH
jgi:hypothetical protein